MFLLTPVFLLITVVLLISCKGMFEDEYVCESNDFGYGTFQACCNSTDCYYEYNGKKYWCDGTDCDEAAEDLVDDMMNKTSCENLTEEKVSFLIESIKALN
ncbi:MAG: hypothetical protein PF541_14055 [Prolixibacteraceae bacterium]|jgi:hypothetical protein|nr:hypothetical protein [Prolixibacteraceae bacterium]